MSAANKFPGLLNNIYTAAVDDDVEQRVAHEAVGAVDAISTRREDLRFFFVNADTRLLS